MTGLTSPLHIVLVLVVVLLVFGAKRLPEMGKSLGEGLRGFKESVTGDSPTENPLSALMASSDDTAADTPASAARERTPAQPVA